LRRVDEFERLREVLREREVVIEKGRNMGEKEK
jgi:hypothetical protein